LLPQLRQVFLAIAWVAAAIAPLPACAATPPERHRLIVYYGNETTQQAFRSDNYTTLLRILGANGSAAALASVEELTLEARLSREVSIRDSDILRRYARRAGVDIALFSNEAAVAGSYRYLRQGSAAVEERALPAMVPAANRILALSPLARLDVFRAALEEVTSLYPPGTLDVVLIVKSHGTPEMALTPRLSADMSLTTGAEVIRQFQASPENATPAPWARIQGIDKLEFWPVLADLGSRRGVQFPLVFREVCEGGLVSWAEFAAVPPNVGRIAHSAMDTMSAASIDLSPLARDGGRPVDWVDPLVATLGKQGVHIDEKLTIWRWLVLEDLRSLPLAVYFVPLVLWLGWQAWHHFHVRSRATTAPPRPT